MCAAAYSGVLCQTEINECASNPCRNGGTCKDALNGFSCFCLAGFSGAVCQTNINECASNPCLTGNSVSCTDLTNGFLCSCAAGWSGLRCEININECASNPCRNGGVCNDFVNAYGCTCNPGFSGLYCQTNINECASNPCSIHGTCLDAINRFICSCALGWSGPLCSDDVNECLANNGDCGSLSICTNTIGSYSCSGFIIPGTLASPAPIDAISTPNALKFLSLSGQLVTFSITAYLNDFSLFSVTVGPRSDRSKYACAGFNYYNSPNTVNQPCECTVSNGIGLNYLYLWKSGVLVFESNDTISYASPIISPGSLRQNRTGYSSAPSSLLVLDTTNPVSIQFDGQFFDPTTMLVKYGPPSNPTLHACIIFQAQSSPTTITCNTEIGSQNSGNFVHVTVGGFSADGVDELVFPITPTVRILVVSCRLSLPRPICVLVCSDLSCFGMLG